MILTFWGTRGSIPAPGPDTVRIGGNTTCLEVVSDAGQRITVDAGTGVRNLGQKMIRDGKPTRITLLLTHSHWDHLAGFTFFNPAYDPDYSISVYGNRMAQEVLRRDIYERNDNRYFPVNNDALRADIEFHDEMPRPLIIEDIRITTLDLNHPGNGYAFCFENNGKKVAFVTDNEIGLQYEGGNTPLGITNFCRGVDVLIHDAQFLPSEIEKVRTWGHSTYEEVADLAHKAGVKSIILTHHAPERNDNDCDSLLRDAIKYIRNRSYKMKCTLAIEGESFSL